MDGGTIVVAVLVPAVCCGLVLAVAAFFRCFVYPRGKAPTVIVPIHYMPDIRHEEESFEEYSRRATKRYRRKLRIRQFVKEHSQKQDKIDINDYKDEESETDDDDKDDEDANMPWILKVFSGKHLQSFLLTGSFAVPNPTGSSKTGKSSKSGKKRKDIEKGDDDDDEEDDEEGGEGKSSKKRFISQDRLARAEARKVLIENSRVKVEEEVLVVEDVIQEEVTSILDLKGMVDEKKKQILERKHAQRQEERKDALERGEVDIIKINAGPVGNEIPPGYTVVEFIPDLDPKRVVYKRILYKWVGEGKRPSGWFIGTVVGTSGQRGYNFNIKYDRAETKSIWIDGVQPVLLLLEGEAAYGRKWVLLNKMEDAPNLRFV